MQNVIAAIFETESEGFQAMTQLRQNPVTEQSVILQMALVKRGEKEITVCDSFDSGVNTKDDMIRGGMIGSLLGILGGPIGVLFLGSYGAMTGSLLDSADALDDAAILEKVAEKLCDGEVALIALVDETNEEDLNQRIGQFKTQILRYDAEAVAVEVDEAVEMQLEMEHQARMKIRKAKREEHQKAVEKLNAEFDEYERKLRRDPLA